MRRISPNIVHTQENANEKTTSSADPGRHDADDPAVGPEAEDQAETRITVAARM